MSQRIHQSIAFALLGLLPVTAVAQSDDALQRRVQQLEAQLIAVTGELSELKRSLNNKSKDADNKASLPQKSTVSVSLKPGPKFVSGDGSTSFSLGGRITADAGFVENDDADLGNAINLRRLWLSGKGHVADDWKYRFQLGFETEKVSVKDTYLAYEGYKGLSIKAGHYKEFNGIENVSSNLNTTFMERSVAVTAFRPLRNIGLGGIFYHDWLSVQLGIFGDDPSNAASDDEGYSYTGRIVAAPIIEGDHLLHLGVAARHRTPDREDDSVRFRERGESNVIDDRLVDTGAIANVDDWVTYAAEAMYRYGPLTLQGEYNQVQVDRDALPGLTFDGGYFQASYFLTGDQRGYELKDGIFKGVKVKEPFSLSQGGSGAWEIAARYTNLNLNDQDVLGGELNAYTFGLNWYPNDNVKFMTNYVINDTDDNALTPNNDPHFLMLRSQIHF